MSRVTQELAFQIASDAMSRPEQERSDFVRSRCGEDPQLRRMVDERIGALVLGGLVTLDMKPTHGSPTLPPSLEGRTIAFLGGAELPGDQIGPYRIIAQIGEGGFGTVYLAEQTEPVRRQVAVKILKPGMDSRQIIGRFEAERQALAMMDHPGIAKVFDAGTTLAGRPFFVMELVKGEAMTRHCDARRLSTRERLSLFVQVCRAVQHAHHKGIIHRDIKPTNVLVAADEQGATPKVIDFGIAKAVGRSLSDKVAITEVRQLIGTPEYMSPEQAEADGLDIDTRADVYSLGVLLYELLTGTTPFDGAQIRSAAYIEVRRIMREIDPPRPSTRLSSIGAAGGTEIRDGRVAGSVSVDEVARLRGTNPSQLVRQVRGELDWIVMRAIEKDRNRRYQSASALAADVERFLRDEPIEARPPSVSYKIGKFVARHRIAVAAGVLLVISMLGTVVALFAGYVHANAQRDIALRARANEAAARQSAEESVQFARAADYFFLERILGSAQPDVASGRDLTVAEVVELASEEVHKIKDPSVQAEVQDWLGRAYLSLGRLAEADSHLRRAVELSTARRGANADVAVRANFALAQVMVRAGMASAAIEGFADAEKRWRESHGPNHPNIAWAMQQRADALVRLGRIEEAAALAENALVVYRELGDAAPADQLAMTLNLRASLLAQTGEPARAEALLRESLDVQHDADVPRSLEPSTRVQLANALVSMGRASESVEMIEEALALRLRILPEGHEQIAQARAALARACLATGEFARAAGAARQAADAYRVTLGADHEYTATAMSTLGAALHQLSRYPEAAAAFAAAVKSYSASVGERDWRTCNAKVLYASALVKQGRLDDAEAILNAVEDACRRPDVPREVHRAAVQGLIALYTLRGDSKAVDRWNDVLASLR